MRRAKEPVARPVEAYKGLTPTFGEELGKAFLGARPVIHAVFFVAIVVALRAWGPIELRMKIDSWTEMPLARSRAAMSSGWTQATGLARTVEASLGWRAEVAASTAEADSF